MADLLPKRLLNSTYVISGKPACSLSHSRLNATFGKIIIINTQNSYQKIRSLVKTIPFGRVTTYGHIATAIGTNPRVVGWALHNNEDVTIPCHRVVKKDGLLAANFSLGNWPEQRRRLEAEGLKFSGMQIIDFSQIFFDLTVGQPLSKC